MAALGQLQTLVGLSLDRLIYLNEVATSVVEDGVFDPITFRWLL